MPPLPRTAEARAKSHWKTSLGVSLLVHACLLAGLLSALSRTLPLHAGREAVLLVAPAASSTDSPEPPEPREELEVAERSELPELEPAVAAVDVPPEPEPTLDTVDLWPAALARAPVDEPVIAERVAEREPEPRATEAPPREPQRALEIAVEASAAPPPTPVRSPEPVEGYTPSPTYPARARRMGWQGEVVCVLSIGADGSVLDVRVERSSGYALLDESALDALRKWRFRPAERGGEPIPMDVRKRLVFELDA